MFSGCCFCLAWRCCRRWRRSTSNSRWLAIGLVQLSEGWLLARAPRRGAAYIVLLKIALATLLIDHTGEIGINSTYWPIYFLPAVTAAEYFSPLGDVVVDGARLCRILFVSLSCVAGL